jgi:5'-deoxynucleotidase YfbR-like HD superfamily hydrolase
MTADPFHTGAHPGGMSQDGKHFIASASGRPVDLLHPQPEMITLDDVARGLSMTCRFAGQVDRFYSVAEHCAFVHDLVRSEYPDASPELLGWALLHDAQEAYIHDLTGPLKHALQLIHGESLGATEVLIRGLVDPYAEIEARWTEAVRLRFGLPVPNRLEVQAVKRFDHRAACLEGGRLKRNEPFYSNWTKEPLPSGVQCAFGRTPDRAAGLFLNRCDRLGIE